jgi:hypothetical protein
MLVIRIYRPDWDGSQHMKNAKNAGLVTVAVAVFFSFLVVITQQGMAVAQMTIDQLCDSFCDAPQESGENLGTEQTEEAISGGAEESLPTIDEFIDVLNAEREFDDQRMAEEQQENGIYDARNIPTTTIFSDDAKATLINQTFTKLLNNNTESEESAAAEPDIEEVEEEIDIDEVAQRQIISYEFDEEERTVIDDIRIYTEPEETIQSLASTITTFKNKTNIDLYANGRMIITYAGGFSSDEADDTRIYAPHNYTIVNGYTYVNNTIYDENGIEVFADPNTT